MTVNTSIYLSSSTVDILGIHCWQHIICLLRALVIIQFHYLFCMEENPWNQHSGTIPFLPWIRSVWEWVSIVSMLGLRWKKKAYVPQSSWIESIPQTFIVVKTPRASALYSFISSLIHNKRKFKLKWSAIFFLSTLSKRSMMGDSVGEFVGKQPLL